MQFHSGTITMIMIIRLEINEIIHRYLNDNVNNQ